MSNKDSKDETSGKFKRLCCWLIGRYPGKGVHECTTANVLDKAKPLMADADTKELCQILEHLWRHYFENFVRRQSYEWKAVVVLWTPIVLFLGYGLTGKLGGVPPWYVGIASGAYFLIHCFWQFNLERSNAFDIGAFRDISDHMRDIAGLQTIKERYRPRYSGLRRKNWGHRTYLAVTLALLTVANWLNVRAQVTSIGPFEETAVKLRKKAVQQGMTLAEYVDSHLKVLAEGGGIENSTRHDQQATSQDAATEKDDD